MSTPEQGIARAAGRRRAVRVNRGPGPRTPIEAALECEMYRVMRAVSDRIPGAAEPLPDAFFPAHLTVALIDAVFGAGSDGCEASAATRYCRRRGLARRRPDPWTLPPVEAQETLGVLVERCTRLGASRDGDLVAGTWERRAARVLRLARALRGLGVETLQDVQARRPGELGAALRVGAGLDGGAVLRLLSYTGDDDFVWVDGAVRGFVAQALGRRTVSAARAAFLLRRAAWELILSPRALDYGVRDVERASCDGISGVSAAKAWPEESAARIGSDG